MAVVGMHKCEAIEKFYLLLSILINVINRTLVIIL